MQGSSSLATRQILSKLTLALMVDSGWYESDLSLAPDLAYGYHKGCSFLIESCSWSQLPDLFEAYFCPAEVKPAYLSIMPPSLHAETTSSTACDLQAVAL
eukprot:scaffold5079_cov37-Prasinocladus_malaysianus.AAC.1